MPKTQIDTAGERQLKKVRQPQFDADLPEALKRETTLDWDPSEIDLIAQIGELLELAPGSSLDEYTTETDLWNLKGRQALQARLVVHPAMEAYHRLMRDVIGPHLLQEVSPD